MNQKFKKYEEIQKLSEDLIGRPISEFYSLKENLKDKKNKGYLGNSIQEKIFGIAPNNSIEADFKQSGLDLELKVIPFKKTKGFKVTEKFQAKERLSLSMINFCDLAKESFEQSHLFSKHQHIQFIGYTDDFGGKIITAFQTHWNELPQSVRLTIQDDYSKIREKVIRGEAHLLSESDTTILAAARKGAGKGRDNRKQPFSDKLAKSRVFSIKPRYVGTLFYSMRKKDAISLAFLDSYKSGEEYAKGIFDFLEKNLLGLNVYQYAERILHFKKPKKVKHAAMAVIKKALSKHDSKILKNLEAYGYKIRTITVSEKNKIQEQIPLPHAINPDEMLNWETNFEDSDVYHQLMDYKFMFIPVRKTNTGLFIEKPFVFYFSENDETAINNLKYVWSNTRDLYKKPKIKQNKINKKGQDYHLIDFIRQSNDKTFHVRPKAKNSEQLYKIGENVMIVPHAFWINKKVIQKAWDDSRELDAKNNS